MCGILTLYEITSKSPRQLQKNAIRIFLFTDSNIIASHDVAS